MKFLQTNSSNTRVPIVLEYRKFWNKNHIISVVVFASISPEPTEFNIITITTPAFKANSTPLDCQFAVVVSTICVYEIIGTNDNARQLPFFHAKIAAMAIAERNWAQVIYHFSDSSRENQGFSVSGIGVYSDYL